MPKWTPEHSAEARKEGWDVWSVDGFDSQPEIQKSDEWSPFKTDAEALCHVLRYCGYNSPLHVLACELEYSWNHKRPPTSGPWYSLDYGSRDSDRHITIYNGDNVDIAEVYCGPAMHPRDGDPETNARLIIEAGTVYHELQKSPFTLATEHARLLAYVESVAHSQEILALRATCREGSDVAEILDALLDGARVVAALVKGEKK